MAMSRRIGDLLFLSCGYVLLTCLSILRKKDCLTFRLAFVRFQFEESDGSDPLTVAVAVLSIRRPMACASIWTIHDVADSHVCFGHVWFSVHVLVVVGQHN